MTETIELSTPLAVPSCLMELLQLDLGAGLELQPCLTLTQSSSLELTGRFSLVGSRSCLSSMVRSGSGLSWTGSATSPSSLPLVLLCYIHIYLSLAFRIALTLFYFSIFSCFLHKRHILHMYSVAEPILFVSAPALTPT
jgi:hypothetical protein